MPAGFPDYIGPVAFFSISGFPHVPKRHFTIERFAGLNGVSIWDTGESGVQFTVRCKRALVTYPQAQQFYLDVKATLENSGAFPIQLGGVFIPGMLYKTIDVRPVNVKQSVAIAIGNESTLYSGWCELDIDLVPIKAPAP